jgi:hypothetical protein
MSNEEFSKMSLTERANAVRAVLQNKGLQARMINIILDVITLEFQYRILKVDEFENSEGFKTLMIDGVVKVEEQFGIGRLSLAKRSIYIKRGCA